VDAEEFHAERERSVEALDELAHQISGRKPLSEREQIEKKLEEAITEEAFEQRNCGYEICPTPSDAGRR